LKELQLLLNAISSCYNGKNYRNGGASVNRIILHADLDAFFAAVEQRDHPELRGKPVIIGADPRGRGVVSTASYEARRYGVHSAQPIGEAYRRCPGGIFLRPRMERYLDASRQVEAIFNRYTPLVEMLSVDEAFLDLTGCAPGWEEAEQLAGNLKKAVQREVGLSISVGVASNKFLAKLASDLEKPDGLVIVRPDGVDALLEPLSVRRIWGVGEKAQARLAVLGIRTMGELKQLPVEQLMKLFGSFGYELYSLARGRDDRPVNPEHERKSLGRERTFAADVSDPEILKAVLLSMSEEIGYRLRLKSLKGNIITLKLRYGDFRTFTRQRPLDAATNWDTSIYQGALELFNKHHNGREVRLLGISLSGLEPAEQGQLSLFGEGQTSHNLARSLDEIKFRFGPGAVTRAGALMASRKSRQEKP